MARLPYVEPDLAVTEEIKTRRGGALRPLDKVLLHNPTTAEGWNTLLRSVRQNTGLSDADRELIICRVAALNGAQYEWDAHAPLAIRGGMTEEQLKYIGYGGSSPLSSHQQLLVDLTDQLTLRCMVQDATFEELRTSLGDAGVQDAVLIASAYNMVSRYLLALRVGEPDTDTPGNTASGAGKDHNNARGE